MSNKHSVPDEGPPSLSTQDQKGSGFALPELEHNLQLLIDLTEQDILQVWGKQNISSNICGLCFTASFTCTTLQLLCLRHTVMFSLFLSCYPNPCSLPDVCSMKKMLLCLWAMSHERYRADWMQNKTPFREWRPFWHWWSVFLLERWHQGRDPPCRCIYSEHIYSKCYHYQAVAVC